MSRVERGRLRPIMALAVVASSSAPAPKARGPNTFDSWDDVDNAFKAGPLSWPADFGELGAGNVKSCVSGGRGWRFPG